MTPEQEIDNLKKRVQRLERKLLQKELTISKAHAPKTKEYLKQEQRYNIRKYLMEGTK